MDFVSSSLTCPGLPEINRSVHNVVRYIENWPFFFRSVSGTCYPTSVYFLLVILPLLKPYFGCAPEFPLWERPLTLYYIAVVFFSTRTVFFCTTKRNKFDAHQIWADRKKKNMYISMITFVAHLRPTRNSRITFGRNSI